MMGLAWWWDRNKDRHTDGEDILGTCGCCLLWAMADLTRRDRIVANWRRHGMSW